MTNRSPALAVASLLLAAGSLQAQEKLHYTYLWHMEQPIYWPQRDRGPGSADKYELAASSIDRKLGGAAHPLNDVADIFSVADRVAGYQYRMRDSIDLIRGRPEAGAQISFSGGLIENLNSLGSQNRLGYSPGWTNWLREARQWDTHSGKPRADIVLFSHHHALLPLVDPVTVRKQVQLYKSVYPDAWGTGEAMSRGLFPPEMAFSTRLIEALAAEGVQWVIVSGEKISRAAANFPVQFGSGGINCDPPNRADQVNAAQNDWFKLSISRGCAPTEAVPLAFRPSRARYVNPETGAISSMIVVPASQSLGWVDGYNPIGVDLFDTVQSKFAANNGGQPTRPPLVLLAHDGDNAWGGGFSYYMEAVPNTANTATAPGRDYVPSTVEEYLADHPIPVGDPFVHVEDGAWVNADGDFGAPQFINWNWPPLNSSGQIDIPNGWHVDIRNWAVITAMQNRVETAEQIAGGINIRRVLYPETAGTTNAERAWHYFFGALNSGYMYYGNAIDMEDKPALACNEAARNADPVIGNASLDQTAPTIWAVQRHPWNPGSTNFGPQHGYQQRQNNGDFWIWTFAYDVSGLQSVTLKYRLDNDGQRSLANTENETYAGGPGVGAWQSLPMTRRAFPAGNVFNDPSITFTVTPQYIADQYHVQLTGVRSKLVDYYVEAVDNKGRVKRSQIQHVWVGDGSGAGSGGGPTLAVNPATLTAGQSVTVTYNPSGRPLAGQSTVRMHHGFNGWQNTTQIPMTLNSQAGTWSVTITLPTSASMFDLVFTNGSGLWDNNGGQDWHLPVSGGVQPFVMDGNLDASAVQVAANGTRRLYAALQGNRLYLAGPAPAAGNDAFLFLANPPGALRGAHWGKAGQVANWAAFIGAESDSNFVGWTDAAAAAGTQVARGTVIEGTIDLMGEFAALPEKVYLASAAYPTANGSSLIASLQVPASTNGNATLDANEYVEVALCALAPGGCCPVDYDRGGTFDQEDLSGYITSFMTEPPAPGIAGFGYGQPCPQNAAPYQFGYDADFNRDCAFDQEDLTAFITAFFEGCP